MENVYPNRESRLQGFLLQVTSPRLEWSTLHWIAIGREPVKFGPRFRQAVRVLLLLKLDQFFPHQTAQIPGLRGIRRARQGSYLQGVFGDVADLDAAQLLVAQRRRFQDAAQLMAQFFDGSCVVRVNVNGGENVTRPARPVLKHVLDEIR